MPAAAGITERARVRLGEFRTSGNLEAAAVWVRIIGAMNALDGRRHDR